MFFEHCTAASKEAATFEAAEPGCGIAYGSLLQPKEPVEIICGLPAYFLPRQAPQLADVACRFFDVGGLIALPAVRNGGEIGRVGFDEHSLQWNLSRRVANLLGFREADIARK
jgi:hypothetical protein